jgi:hypothetical protein
MNMKISIVNVYVYFSLKVYAIWTYDWLLVLLCVQ